MKKIINKLKLIKIHKKERKFKTQYGLDFKEKASILTQGPYGKRYEALHAQAHIY